MRVRRFHGSRGIPAVRAAGLSAERGGVRIYCRRGAGSTHRIAVICGRTVARRAVVRNRIRRVFFEALRVMLQDAESPVDCIVQIRAGFDGRDLSRHRAESIVSVATPMLGRL